MIPKRIHTVIRRSLLLPQQHRCPFVSSSSTSSSSSSRSPSQYRYRSRSSLRPHLFSSQAHTQAVNTGIPKIDISLFLGNDEAARKEVAQQWDEAMSEVGFCIIKGFEPILSREVSENMYASASEFFQLDDATKMESCLHEGYGNGGYLPQGIEAVARSTGADEAMTAPPDLVENLVFQNSLDAEKERMLPTTPESLVPHARLYWKQATGLLHVLMELSAVSLGLDKDHFVASYMDPDTSLRLAYYPPQTSASPPEENQMRYGAHTDYLGFTLLRTDHNYEKQMTSGGLEVKLANGEWTSVRPGEGELVINAGDLLPRWTNDRWASALHRVSNPVLPPSPPSSSSSSSSSPPPSLSTSPSSSSLSSSPPPEKEVVSPARLSIVFFTGPSVDTVISPIGGAGTSASGVEKYPPITAGEHVRLKIARSNI